MLSFSQLETFAGCLGYVGIHAKKDPETCAIAAAKE